jgi:copper transport protein
MSVSAEIALIAAILSLVALWRFTPPPRALPSEAPQAVEPAVASIHGVNAMAEVTLTPEGSGRMKGIIAVMKHDHTPLEAKEVSLFLALPVQGVEPIERKGVKASAGRWQVDSLPVPVHGCWDVRIEVLVSDFEKTTLEHRMAIPPARTRACSG